MFFKGLLSETRQPCSFARRLARRALPPAGGLHRTWMTLPLWLARFSANISSPTLMTRGGAASKAFGSRRLRSSSGHILCLEPCLALAEGVELGSNILQLR